MNESKVHLTDLYEHTSKAGNTYLTGFLGKSRVLVFVNKDYDPEDPKSPKWNVYVVTNTPYSQQSASQDQTATQERHKVSVEAQKPPQSQESDDQSFDNDDIPF